MSRLPRRHRRAGFTLVELLVVIGIIAVLASLVAGTAVVLIGVQKKNNTNQLLKQTQEGLFQHWKATVDQAKVDAIPPAVVTLATPPGVPPTSTARARVMWVHLRLRMEFPMSYAEAASGVSNASYGINIPASETYKNAIGSLAANAFTPAQSAACLQLALARTRRGATFVPDQALGAASLKDTDGDTLREICDGYGNPVGFWRWPSNFTELSQYGSTVNLTTFKPTNPNHKANPLDPEGLLTDPAWNNWTNRQAVLAFEAMCGGGYVIHQGNSAQTWIPWINYTVPVVGSAGPDGQFGYNLTNGDWFSMNNPSAQANDNIFSNRLVPFGKGD